MMNIKGLFLHVFFYNSDQFYGRSISKDKDQHISSLPLEDLLQLDYNNQGDYLASNGSEFNERNARNFESFQNLENHQKFDNSSSNTTNLHRNPTQTRGLGNAMMSSETTNKASKQYTENQASCEMQRTSNPDFSAGYSSRYFPSNAAEIHNLPTQKRRGSNELW